MKEPLDSCTKCHRISKNLLDLKNIYTDYHNKPVQGVGSKDSSICIVGLAPGLHGANKTGIVFNGDFSGNILSYCLKSVGFIDPLEKDYPYITNSVKCYPPNNKPYISEVDNCSRFLKKEIFNMSKLRVIIALGKLSHLAVLKIYKLIPSKYIFQHGKIHKLLNNIILIDSYHCSKLNINTKRVTIQMLNNILFKAKQYKYKHD
ncbi:MAG: uracil-DNA glycosylase [Gammaproteobacteria bacterium]|nr:uracil-DNA glycosylase [Gammaproteobacteria bacterium]